MNKEEIKKISLTPQERYELRSRIMKQIDAEHAAPTPSPYSMLFRRTHWYGAYAIVMILLFVVPTTFAAGRSLPGSPLYYLKTDILEPLEEILTFNSEKKIAVMIDNAEKRLTETRQVLEHNTNSAEEITIASKTLSKKVEKARNSIAKAETPNRAEKIHLQKDLLILVDSYVAILENDESAEEYTPTIASMIDASDELKEVLRESMQDFQQNASHDELVTEVAEVIKDLQERLDKAASDDTENLNPQQRDIIEKALENTQKQLEDARLGDALEILLFSDHEISISEKIRETDKRLPRINKKDDIVQNKETTVPQETLNENATSTETNSTNTIHESITEKIL